MKTQQPSQHRPDPAPAGQRQRQQAEWELLLWEGANLGPGGRALRFLNTRTKTLSR